VDRRATLRFSEPGDEKRQTEERDHDAGRNPHIEASQQLVGKHVGTGRRAAQHNAKDTGVVLARGQLVDSRMKKTRAAGRRTAARKKVRRGTSGTSIFNHASHSRHRRPLAKTSANHSLWT
jgi:hypothetical protein